MHYAHSSGGRWHGPYQAFLFCRLEPDFSCVPSLSEDFPFDAFAQRGMGMGVLGLQMTAPGST
jgi:hypothetical protein